MDYSGRGELADRQQNLNQVLYSSGWGVCVCVCVCVCMCVKGNYCFALIIGIIAVIATMVAFLVVPSSFI